MLHNTLTHFVPTITLWGQVLFIYREETQALRDGRIQSLFSASPHPATVPPAGPALPEHGDSTVEANRPQQGATSRDSSPSSATADLPASTSPWVNEQVGPSEISSIQTYKTLSKKLLYKRGSRSTTVFSRPWGGVGVVPPPTKSHQSILCTPNVLLLNEWID